MLITRDELNGIVDGYLAHKMEERLDVLENGTPLKARWIMRKKNIDKEEHEKDIEMVLRIRDFFEKAKKSESDESEAVH